MCWTSLAQLAHLNVLANKQWLRATNSFSRSNLSKRHFHFKSRPQMTLRLEGKDVGKCVAVAVSSGL